MDIHVFPFIRTSSFIQSNGVNYLNKLTHSGQVTPYDNIELGQHWLRQWLVAWRGNGLVPDDTKPLPESMLTYH